MFGAEQQHTALSLSLAYARDAHKSLSISANDPAIRRMVRFIFFSERGRKIGGGWLSRKEQQLTTPFTRCVSVCSVFYDGGFVLGVCVRGSLSGGN